MSYAVIARYECAPTDVDIIRTALVAMRERTPSEPGNLQYTVHTEIGQKGVFVLYERYVDKTAFEAHKSSEHFVEHIAGTVFPRLTGRTVTFAEEL